MLSAGSISYAVNADNENKLEKFTSEEDKKLIEKPKEKKQKTQNIKIEKVININGSKYYDNKQDSKFIFYDYKNTLLGSFNISQLIKFLYTPYTKNTDNNDTTSFELIRNLIFDVELENDDIEIKFRSYMDSPFTGNLEMLLKLSSGLKDYEENIENELSKFDDQRMKKKLKLLLKQFSYCLLNHILRVIYSISEEIKNDNSKKELKDKLLRYSVGINYRIGSYVISQLNNQIEQNNKISRNMINLLEVKSKVLQKVENLEKTLCKQNDKINDLIEAIENKKNIKPIDNKSPNIGLNSSSSTGSKSIASSVEDKLRDKMKSGNIEALFDEDDNYYKSEEAKMLEPIDSLESPRNMDKSETLSQVSGIYKINYEG